MLCEKHFQPDDYVCGTKNLANLHDPKTSKDLTPTKKYLKPDAVPLIFYFPAHLKKKKTARKPPARRLILDSPQSACPQKNPAMKTKLTLQSSIIAELYNMQKDEVLHLANKLKSKHIHWHNVKIKVAVAAQTLGNSVASGI